MLYCWLWPACFPLVHVVTEKKCVDRAELSYIDYRVFQNTPACQLAKAVQDEDTEEIDKIVSENPRIINYQDSKYSNTLLMLTIMDQQLKSFKTLLNSCSGMFF